MSGAQRVIEVSLQAVLGTHRRLHASLGHHRVAIASAQLADQEHLSAGSRGLERHHAPRAAAADHQDIDLFGGRTGDVDVFDDGVGLQQQRQLTRTARTSGATDAQLRRSVLSMVRMEGAHELRAVRERRGIACSQAARHRAMQSPEGLCPGDASAAHDCSSSLLLAHAPARSGS